MQNQSPKGYWFNKRAGRWQAGIMLDQKQKHLGYFDTAEEAHQAYLTAKEQLHTFAGR